MSERIAKERVETVGQSTGYHIRYILLFLSSETVQLYSMCLTSLSFLLSFRLEVKKGPATKLLLMTTGASLVHISMHFDELYFVSEYVAETKSTIANILISVYSCILF